MVPGQHTVDREVLVQERQNLLGTRSSTPITHEIADNSKHGHKLHTRLLHARVGSVANKLRVGARGLDVGKDGVSLGAQGESKEGGAHVGGDTGNDDLLLARGLDGGLEFWVVPGAGSLLDDFL